MAADRRTSDHFFVDGRRTPNALRNPNLKLIVDYARSVKD
jgi:hypothetical protein